MQRRTYSSYYDVTVLFNESYRHKMDIQYIFHSGFLIKTEQCNIILDYYKGELPKLEAGVPVIVMASHAHKDHYNPEIFDLLRAQGITKITAVLAKDIRKELYPEGIEVITARMHREYEACGVSIYTIQSTDAGVGYLFSVNGRTLFHAGDYNLWDPQNKQMLGMFRHELQELRTRLSGASLDALFFPLDPRLYDAYDAGLLEFLKVISADKIYPMHFWEHPECIKSFIKAHPQYAGAVIDYTEDTNYGKKD